MDRVKLHQLLTLLRERRGIKFTQLVEQMQSKGANITYEDFKRRYIRSDRLKSDTVLDSAEIVHIIHAFITTERGIDTTFCTAFEVVLMAVWSGTGLSTLKSIHSIYGILPIERATRYFYELDEDSFNYFDETVRDSIDAKLQTPNTVASNPYVLDLKPYAKRKVNVQEIPLDTKNMEFPENWYHMSLRDQVFKINQLVLKDGMYDLADKLIDSIIDQARNETQHLCDLLHYRGMIKTNSGAYAEAEHLLNQALDLANDTQRPRILANLGNNAWYKGDHEQTITYIEMALKLAEEPVVRVYLETMLGSMLHAQLQTDRAREHYRHALEEAKQAKLMERQIYLLMNLAALDYDENRMLSARQNIDHALQVYKQTGVQLQPDLHLRLHWNHAAISGYWDNYIGAIEQLHRIYREADKLGFEAMYTRIDIEIAKLHLCYGNHDVALQLYQSFAQNLFDNENSINDHKMKAIYGIVLSIIMRSSTLSISRILKDLEGNLPLHWKDRLGEPFETLLYDNHSYFKSGIGQRIAQEIHELATKVIQQM